MRYSVYRVTLPTSWMTDVSAPRIRHIERQIIREPRICRQTTGLDLQCCDVRPSLQRYRVFIDRAGLHVLRKQFTAVFRMHVWIITEDRMYFCEPWCQCLVGGIRPRHRRAYPVGLLEKYDLPLPSRHRRNILTLCWSKIHYPQCSQRQQTGR